MSYATMKEFTGPSGWPLPQGRRQKPKTSGRAPIARSRDRAANPLHGSHVTVREADGAAFTHEGRAKVAERQSEMSE
jgi:hypothetical protein